jgi:FKBP-type peptidyl-prolyl cis-trans isomerase
LSRNIETDAGSVGEEATITVEPHWAYGDKPPAGTSIPKNATLIFEMRLLAAGF